MDHAYKEIIFLVGSTSDIAGLTREIGMTGTAGASDGADGRMNTGTFYANHLASWACDPSSSVGPRTGACRPWQT